MSLGAWIGVALLGGAGAIARFVVQSGVDARFPGLFPFGTLAVNVSGAFALGVLSGAGVAGDAFVLTGIATLGSYTTFSTWMLESHRLGEAGAPRALYANLAAATVLGLLALTLGHVLAA